MLSSLGFNTYQEYLDSRLWEIIRKVVFERDNFKCQMPGCKHKRDYIEAHHVSYSRATLLGANPGAIITLCRIHHQRVEFSGKPEYKKLTLEKVQKKTVRHFRVAKDRKPKSVADWLRFRFRTQRHIARRVTLLLRSTPYYSRLVEELRRGRIPKEYFDYLGIKREGV